MWKLSNLCTARQALIREDNTCTAIRSICRTNHTIALYAAEFCRLEVCNQNDFLSNEVFRLVPLCNTRNNLSAAHAVIQLQFQQLFRLFHLFACYDLCNPQINFSEIVNGDFRSKFCNWSSFFFCWLLRFVVLDDGVQFFDFLFYINSREENFALVYCDIFWENTKRCRIFISACSSNNSSMRSRTQISLTTV